jgi:hypothetical protein
MFNKFKEDTHKHLNTNKHQQIQRIQLNKIKKTMQGMNKVASKGIEILKKIKLKFLKWKSQEGLETLLKCLPTKHKGLS